MRQRSVKSTIVNWLLSDVELKSSLVSGVTSPDDWFRDMMGANPAQSGISVNPTTAMQCTPVNRAVTLIATSVGNLPVKVFKRLGGGGKEADPTHAAYALVHDDATEWQSAAEFRERITADALLHGDGFALVQRDADGRPVELIYLPPGTVQPKVDDFGEPFYLIGTDQRRYGFRDVLHVAAPLGLAPIKTCREAIGLALVLERYAARLFGNGARPSGILSLKDKADATALANINAAWNAAHGGGKSGGTAFLPGDAEYQQLTFSSVDAQFAEMRAFQIGEIARAFGVPPILLQDYSRATWSNSESMGRQFLQFTLLPWLQSWQAAYRRVLLSPDERSTHLIDFVVDDILRADFGSRVEGYAKLISSRVLNPNEVRAMENRPPYPGGDEFVNPNTMTAGTPAAPAPAPQENPDAA